MTEADFDAALAGALRTAHSSSQRVYVVKDRQTGALREVLAATYKRLQMPDEILAICHYDGSWQKPK